MALTAAALEDEIDAQLSNLVGTDYDGLSGQLKSGIARAVANAVHLWLVGGTGQSGALPGATISVSTTLSVTSVSGVTTGPGVSGPGTGTGSGTGSIS